MGITIVQKSNLSSSCAKNKCALILAGGAVTGGSFMAGGLKALNDYFTGKCVSDFDMFVGISAGSILSAPIMAGISPESILKSLDGTSSHFAPLNAWHYYKPNFSELFSRPLLFAAKTAAFFSKRLIWLATRHGNLTSGIFDRVVPFLMNPSISSYEKLIAPLISQLTDKGLPSLAEILPSGLFDGSGIESYIRKNIEHNFLTNDFCKAKRLTGKALYISAVRLSDGKRTVFGYDENNSVSMSEAIWASTSMPGFYKPACINGVDYVDGGVQQTANIDIAVEKGAKLIVCYNPFRPYEPDDFVDGISQNGGRPISADGVLAVLNQIFRAFFHSRLVAAIDNYRKSDFDGDIILIEPKADDKAFFVLNPLFLRNRVEAAKIGFSSVRNSIEEKYNDISKIMSAYGFSMRRDSVERELTGMAVAKEESGVQMILEGAKGKPARKGSARIKRTVKRIKTKRASANKK